MIPMVNLKAQHAKLKADILKALSDIIDSGDFILGPNVTIFEAESAHVLGVKHAIGVASGTDALHLALLANGIGPGDEVITTPFTFIATSEAIRYVGATPVFADIDPQTFNLCPKAVKEAVTPKTKAILPVHLFGQAADMMPMQRLCSRYDLKLIEDCAQSFGATINGQQTGSFGDAAAFSFYPSKNLGACGDGGLVVTNSDETATKIMILRNHGAVAPYTHNVIGYNSRLDEMQAAILRIKIKHLKENNRRRRQAAQLYNKLLADLPLVTPYEESGFEHVYHQYTVLCDRREEVMKALQEHEIASAIYYKRPIHQQNAFADQYSGLHLPVAESVASRCLSLPICPELTDAEIALIVSVIKGVLLN